MHLVLYRILEALPLTVANVAAAVDYLNAAAQKRIFDDTVLQLLFVPSATTAATIVADYTEVHR